MRRPQRENILDPYTHVRPESGSPITGWPEVKVRGMAQNKSCGVSGAQSLTEFPLNTYNFNEDLVKHILPLNEDLFKHILPLLYPLLLTTAVVIAGNPGAGRQDTYWHCHGHGNRAFSHGSTWAAGCATGLASGEV